MAEFKTIETQEELDKVIQARLDREKKKYEDFLSPEGVQELKNAHLEEIKGFESQIEELKKEPLAFQEKIKELENKNATYERESVKSKVVQKLGLPFESTKYLTGNSEEEYIASGEELKALFSKKQVAPLARQERMNGDELQEAYKKVLSTFKKED